MSYFLQGISLILGLFAIIFPQKATAKDSQKEDFLFLLPSLGACAITIQLQAFQMMAQINQQMNSTQTLDTPKQFAIPLCIAMTVLTLLSNGYAVQKRNNFIKKKKNPHDR